MGGRSSHPSPSQTRGGAFFLHGPDDFRKEESLRSLIEAHLDPATRDFNLDLLRGTEVDGETLASVLATPPMMAEWRVVVLREVEGLASSKKARETLLQVSENPPPGLALLMSCTVPDGSTAKFYKDLARLARGVEFRAISEVDAPGWLMERAREAHAVQLEPEAAQALAAAVGTDLGVLVQELEKLTEFVAGRGVITVKDVETAGTRLPFQDRWSWLDLVADRRFAEAHRALEVLTGQGETAFGLVSNLSTHLLRLGVALEAGQRGLEAALPPHQRWLARKLVGQARRWSRPQLADALKGLLKVDRLLKASPHAPEHFLEEWLLGLRVGTEGAR